MGWLDSILDMGSKFIDNAPSILGSVYAPGLESAGDLSFGLEDPVPGNLPAVDDYSGGYGNAPTAEPSNFSDFGSSGFDGSSSAGSISSLLKSLGSGASDISKLLSPLSPYLSSAAGYAGAAETNKTMRELAESTNTFNAGQAQLNRDFTSDQASRAMGFSERMSNTQWQRTVADMMQAGLNPMLAYSKGVNSSPGGVAASGSSASGVMPGVVNKMSAGISSAVDTSTTMAKVEELEAKADHERALKSAALSLADQLKADTHLKAGQENRISTEIGKMISEIGLNRAETERVIADAKLIAERTATNRFERDHISAQVAHLDLLIPRLFNESKAEMSTWKREAAPYLGDVGKVFNSAGDAAGIARDTALAKRFFNRGSGR